MGIRLVSPTNFPTYIAESTDVVDGKIKGAGIVGGTVYFTDTLTWMIVSGNDLQLVDFKLPANYTELPVATPQTITTDEDTPKSTTLVGAEASTVGLKFIITKQPEHGVLSGTLPAVTYTPEANFFGDDEFQFVVNDGMSNSVPATVGITVTPIDDPPVAYAQSLSTLEDTAKDITLVATDTENNTLTYTVVAGPSHGVLSGTAPNLTYTPTANYHGSDSFTFKANDGTSDSNTAVISIDVVSVEDLPYANDQTVLVAPGVAKAFVLDYGDPDGDVLTYEVITEPEHGGLSGTEPNLTYTPDAGYHGEDSFEYSVTDSKEGHPAATATVTLTVNTAPVATAQSNVAAVQGVGKAITLAGTDADGDDLTYIVVTNPAHGTLSGTAPALTYTAEAEYTGADSFTFKVNDGYADSTAATVGIVVSAP